CRGAICRCPDAMVQGSDGGLQAPAAYRVRRTAEDRDRQGTEIHPAAAAREKPVGRNNSVRGGVRLIGRAAKLSVNWHGAGEIGVAWAISDAVRLAKKGGAA